MLRLKHLQIAVLFAFLFAVVTSMGCGKKAPPFEPIRAPQLALEPWMDASSTCSSDSECQPGAALAVIEPRNGDHSPTLCGAALISSDSVVLPASCLPSGLRAEGADCTHHVMFYFPSMGSLPGESMTGKKVLELKLSDIPNSANLAVVQLVKSTSRKPLQIASTGWKDSSIYTQFSLTQKSQG
ncbi:MAG: hypothetical protein EOP09_18015, partial [Proteobacteria bacterium]